MNLLPDEGFSDTSEISSEKREMRNALNTLNQFFFTGGHMTPRGPC